MATCADKVFKETMAPEMIEMSDRRASELGREWAEMRGELPADVRERLDVARERRSRSAG